MRGLRGKHIAVTGARKGKEISKLIENYGGIPYIRPTQGTVFLDESRMELELDKLMNTQIDWFVLTTGIGTKALLDGAEKLGCKEKVLEILQHSHIASRGYKTKAVLKELGIQPEVQDEDGTVRGLIEALQKWDLQDKTVALQLYGEKSPKLNSWLASAGARSIEILPYEHIPPKIEHIERFIDEIRAQKFDAIAFTSALQVTFLFNEADKLGEKDTLLQAFANRTIAVAVGVVTAEALEDAGVKRIIQPAHQRMGAMITTLHQYYRNEK